MSEELGRCLPDWALRRVESTEAFDNVGSRTPIWVDEQGFLELSKIDDSVDGHYRLRFSDQIVVDLRFDEKVIVERSLSPDVPQSTREHFLIDQVLPRILGHQGRLIVHAGAIRLGDEAFLLLGRSGSGKSTLAASFDSAGYGLLGDDALVISWRGDGPCASAVYPSLRLFPDSIDALFSAAVPTAAVAHYTPKLRLSMPLKDGGDTRALPIKAIFRLGRSPSTSDISVRRKSIADACMALIENSFILDPTDTERAPGRLHDASELARQVPAFDLAYPRAYSRLPEVRAAILQTLDEVPCQGDRLGREQ